MSKYAVIIKVDEDRFVKYRDVTNLMRLTKHLDKTFPAWKYFNVYDAKTREQIGNFTKNDRPTSAKI